MEQRAFARAGRAAHREEIAARDVEAHAPQYFERALAHRVAFGEPAGGKENVNHCGPPKNWEHPTSNIQHPTPNESHVAGQLDVRCWMLDVGCFPSFPFYSWRSASTGFMRLAGRA